MRALLRKIRWYLLLPRIGRLLRKGITCRAQSIGMSFGFNPMTGETFNERSMGEMWALFDAEGNRLTEFYISPVYAWENGVPVVEARLRGEDVPDDGVPMA